jgi:chromosomal replication initiator protein
MNHQPDNEKQIWTRVRKKIKEKVTSQQFTTWFEGLELIKFNVDEAYILAPNSLCSEWIENNYMDVLSSTLGEVTNAKYKVKLVTESKDVKESKPLPKEKNRSNINKNYSFDNFLVGPCNRLAHAAALAVSESPGTAYNPLFIHGPVGLGKTHLLQSIYRELQKRSGEQKVLYMPCESFVNHYISTIRTGDWDSFRNKYRQIDTLLIDDVHFLANSQSTREEFFHTFNALYTCQKQIVLSSDCPPEEIPAIEDRLISRFRWGLITRIDPPGFETSVAIIQKKTALLNMEIPNDVARYLAEHATSSIREIEGTLTNINKYAIISENKIDLGLVKQVIGKPTKHKSYIGIEEILSAVTEHFGVQLSRLHSKRKLKSITLPRQVAMYLARKLTNLSLEEIGGFMGGRDHTTVMHADEKIRNLKKQDRNISATLRKLEAIIKKQHK